jgi:hypothetical protein
MPPKKRPNDKPKIKKYVYVLTLKSVDPYEELDDPVGVVGVYASKAAAVAASGEISTSRWGSFDEMMKDVDFENAVTDNRQNPPSDGTLLKVGDEEHDQGYYEELIIEKFRLEDETSTGRKQEGK